MAVVINEFEVVAAPEPAPPSASPRPADGAPARLEDDIERTLRLAGERARRLHAD